MKLLSLSAVINVMLHASLSLTSEGFVLNYQNPNFLWDLNRCSNINPIVDSQTIILTENGNFEDDNFCTAIRRDLKVTDQVPYEMSTEFNNVSGRRTGSGFFSHLGFMFNVRDDYNFDCLQKVNLDSIVIWKLTQIMKMNKNQ